MRKLIYWDPNGIREPFLAMMFFEEIKAFNRAIKNRREHFRCGFEDEMI